MTVRGGRRQRSRATKPPGPLTWGWKMIPPLSIADIRTAICTTEVLMPAAWLERWPTRDWGTEAGIRPMSSPSRLMPVVLPRPSRNA